MAKIILKECPKAYILETHRSKTPEATHNYIKSMKETLGMKAFCEATDLDRTGIPVFTCHRVRPDQSITDHTGKGISQIQAQVSLTMESTERYSAEFRDEYLKDLIKGGYNTLKLKYNTLNPEELILPRFSNYNHDKELHWVCGFDLVANSDILVPACSVYHPFAPDDFPLIGTNTNGLASGNTMEEAICHALTEVIERDAWSINQFTGEASDSLFVEDSNDNKFIIDIIEKFDKAQIEIVAKDITSDIGIPVIAAYSNDTVYKAMTSLAGFGAHLDPKVAIARALLELAATRALFIQKHDIKGLIHLLSDFYIYKSETYDHRFYTYHQKGLGELETLYNDDILQDVKLIMAKLAAKGFEKIIGIDLTRPETGVPTVRIIVPGMEVYCFDKTRMGERLFDSLIATKNNGL